MVSRAVRCLAALALVACAVEHRPPGGAGSPPLTVIDGAAGAGATSDTPCSDAMPEAGGAPESGAAAAAGGEVNGQGGAPADGPRATTADTVWTFANAADTGDWQPEDGVDQSVSDVDADGSGDSGSLIVTDTMVTKGDDDFVSNGTSVCMPIEGGVTYDVAAELNIDPGQSAGSGGFDVEFLDGSGCNGALLDLADFLTATTGSWELGEKTPTAPAGARSALFRLVASKRASDPPFAVHFDDVRFEPQ